MREERIRKLKTFLQNNHPGIQAFDCRNIAGDYMEVVYVDESSDDNEEDIVAEYCPYWDYLEIFGLTNDEFSSLIDIASTKKSPAHYFVACIGRECQ